MCSLVLISTTIYRSVDIVLVDTTALILTEKIFSVISLITCIIASLLFERVAFFWNGR